MSSIFNNGGGKKFYTSKASSKILIHALFASIAAILSLIVAIAWQSHISDSAGDESNILFSVENSSSSGDRTILIQAEDKSSSVLNETDEAKIVITNGISQEETEKSGYDNSSMIETVLLPQNSSQNTLDGATNNTYEHWVSVDSTYFNDAAFIGDSITTGIKLYGIMDNAQVFAGTGIRLENIDENKTVKFDEQDLTILEALQRTKPKKIYILMGANSLGSPNEAVLNLYAHLIDKIKVDHSKSIIYVQSVLPLYEPLFSIKYGKNITNAQIKAFNTGLQKLANEKGVIYLNIAEAFVDENGAMPKEFTPDGIHINSKQYQLWFDYLKKHAIAISESEAQQ